MTLPELIDIAQIAWAVAIIAVVVWMWPFDHV